MILNLSKACTLKTGKTPPSQEAKYFNGDINWYTPGDLDNDKRLVKSTRTITELAFDEKKAVIFEKGVLLMTCIGEIGKLGITTERCSSNQQITALIPNKELDVEYLYYSMKHLKPLLNKIANNAVVPILNNQNLYKIQIPLPPLETQQRIAAILDAADALRKKTQQIIDSYDELAQSIFLDMFGDPVKNPKGWEKVKFDSLGSIDRGKSKHRPRNAPELLGGEHPLIQTGDIANAGRYIYDFRATYSDIGLAQSKKWRSGTLCITIAANIAKTAILAFDACFPDSVVGFLPNKKTNVVYIQFWLSFLQKILEDSAPESAQKNINLKILKELDVPLPKIDLQTQFAEKIALIDQQKELAKQSLQESEDLFNTLLQKAFKGELV